MIAEEASFLDQLGLRLRRARTAAGVSRRELAVRSGVSERYLAQLEGGQGNVSILLLRRVCDALSLDLQETVMPPVDVNRRGRLALSGLDDAGRCTCALELGERLGLPVFHLGSGWPGEAGSSESESGAGAGAGTGAGTGAGNGDSAAGLALAALVGAHPRCVLDVAECLLAEPAFARILRSRCLTVWLRPAARETASQAEEGAQASPGDASWTDQPGLVPAAPEAAELSALRALRDRLLGRADRIVECAAADPAAWAGAVVASIGDWALGTVGAGPDSAGPDAAGADAAGPDAAGADAAGADAAGSDRARPDAAPRIVGARSSEG